MRWHVGAAASLDLDAFAVFNRSSCTLVSFYRGPPKTNSRPACTAEDRQDTGGTIQRALLETAHKAIDNL